MPQIFSNNAVSTLSAPITNVATTLLVQPGQGSRFPTIAAPDFSYCTLEDSLGNLEIVKVTAHAAGSQSLTIERAQQGTTARAWAIGDLVELRATAAEMSTWEADIDTLQATRALKAGDTYTGAHNFTGGSITVPNKSTGTNTTDAANTAFVQAAVAAAVGGSGQLAATASSSAAVSLTKGQHDFGSYSSGPIAWTLPPAPTFGDTCAVTPLNGRYDNVLDPGAEKLQGLAEALTINNPNVTVTVRYSGSAQGWRLA